MAGSSATKGVLGELAKRVPKNQSKQFKEFLDLNEKYRSRVNKYPAKLPKIDWDYYRRNVRMEATKMVDEFEKKYEELNKVFDERNKLDTKKYYDELEKQRTVVQAEVKNFITESNKRIKAYEAEIVRLCNMKPYSDMTIEEFITLRPECSTYVPFGRKPLFWPHDPEEQIIGPESISKPDDGKGGGSGGNDGGGDQPVTPSDFKDKGKFEFAPVDSKISAQKPPDANSSTKEETKFESVTKKATEPQIHIDKPASEETKKILDPCKLGSTALQNEQSGADPCKGAPKGPYKDADSSKCIFIDPCNTKFGARKKVDVESTGEATDKEKGATKPALNDIAKERKKPSICDSILKKAGSSEKGACKGAPKGPFKDEQGKTCIFMDPCKTEFGAGTKSDIKTVEEEPAKEKSATKMVTNHTEKPIRKANENEKELCEGAAERGTLNEGKEGTCAYINPCKISDARTDKSAKTAKAPESEKEAKKVKMTAESKAAKPEKLAKTEKSVKTDQSVCQESNSEPETKSSSTCKSPITEVTNKISKPTEMPKVERDEAKDVKTCTMMFVEPPKTDMKNQKDLKNSSNSYARTPYNNPFRNDEENRKNEKEICDEIEESNDCKDEERRKDKDYYNPCKDNKEKK